MEAKSYKLATKKKEKKKEKNEDTI